SDPSVAAFNANAIERIAQHLGIETEMAVSSRLDTGDRRTGQERVIHLCKLLGATQYVNPIGGSKLYRKSSFANQGIALSFLESRLSPYDQFGQAKVPGLSIIDVMMFNSDDAVRALLKDFSILIP